MLDQAKSWVIGVIFGTDYPGLHAFCIYLMKIPLLGIEMVKLKQEVEPWDHHACLHSVKSLIFLIIKNILTKATSRRADIYHINVNMYVIC